MKKTVQQFVIILIVGILTLIAGISFAQPPEYKGYSKCKGCHGKEFESWKEGVMNQEALKALMPGERADAKIDAGLDPNKDYTIEAECLTCHATGYGKPGGFVSTVKTPDLAGVTCEACHGPGSKYWRVMVKKRRNFTLTNLTVKGFLPLDSSICDQCHTPGCPMESDSMDYDEAAAHDNFEMRFDHPRDLLQTKK